MKYLLSSFLTWGKSKPAVVNRGSGSVKKINPNGNEKPAGQNVNKNRQPTRTLESSKRVIKPTSMPAIPERLEHSLVVDYTHKIVYVTDRLSGDALFLTWWRDLQLFDDVFQVKNVSLEDIDRLKRSGVGIEGKTTDIIQDNANSARRKAYDLLTWVVGIGGTDLHVTVRQNYTEIQTRLKGSIKLMEQIPVEEGRALCTVLYQGFDGQRPSAFSPSQFQSAQISGPDMTRLGLSSVRLERGFAFPLDHGGQFVSARLQKYDVNAETADYVKKAMETRNFPRFLSEPSRPDGLVDLTKTGLTLTQQNMLFRVSESANGIVLVTGPTGSGKTSLLNLLLRHIAQVYPEKRQITAEDPVEIPMEWAVQLPVSNSSSDKQTGDAFAQYLRIMLRMDPDIIFLGELRGAEAAMAAINAAMTGHLVFSTLHTPDPYMAIDRLERMDHVRLSREVTCDPKLIRALVAQRVIARLCPHCSLPLVENKKILEPWICEALETYGPTDNVRLKGPGCSHCGDGLAGRSAVAEVIVTDDEFMDNMITNRTAKARRAHRKRADADASMVTHAVMRALNGEFDPREIQSRIDVITPYGEE